MIKSIDELKGFLIKIEFNFETKFFDFYVGFPEGWLVDLGVNEITITPDKEVNGAILYIVSPNDQAIDSNLIIKYLLNIIKYNNKLLSAKEKIEKQKKKLEEKLLNDGKSFFYKEITDAKHLSSNGIKLLESGEIKQNNV